jgi:ComF family protein
MLLDLIFPPRCPLCGEGLSGQDGLCPTCWQGLAIPGVPACALCQRPLASDHDSHSPDDLLCASCVISPPLHQGVAAATLYNETSRRLVLAFKHGRKVALAPFMGRMMARRLQAQEMGAGPGWLVVPVPLHRWRLWSRGFNQSALLARAMAGHVGAEALPDALIRRRRTPMLIGLGGDERARVMREAIATHPLRAARLRGASVILTDDVLTSGATTNACITALHEAGAARVVVACFARVTGEALP